MKIELTLQYCSLSLALLALLAAPTSAQSGGTDWPQWGRGQSRNMVSPDKGLPRDFSAGDFKGNTEEIDPKTTKNVRWVAKLGSQSYGNPTVADGRVYVGTNNDSPRDARFKGDRSTVYCFDENTGAFIWQLNVPKLGTGKVSDWEFLGICSSPAIEGNRVYLVTNRCEVICLDTAGISIVDLDYVVFYDKPFVKLERILMTYLATFPRSLPSFAKSIPVWMKEKLWVPSIIRDKLGFTGEVLFAEHHQSHAASAFLPSPFEEAAILTCDGVGEWATTTQGVGRGNKFELIKEIRFPHSLGLLYSAFTYYLGFKVNSAEYKVMGAAPYGDPKYADKILEDIVEVKINFFYAELTGLNF